MPMISRRTSPPGEWWFYQQQTNWPPINNAQQFFAGMTFDQSVDKIIQHRMANPRWKLPTDRETVSDELDFFTCARLKFDPNYCTGGPLGKAPRPLPLVGPAGGVKSGLGAVVDSLKNVAKSALGVGVVYDWLGSGLKVVPKEQAESRASVCSKCPKNVAGGLDTFFTQPVAERLRRHAEVKAEMRLETQYDSRLNICEACRCNLPCKVWVPIEHILNRLKPEMKADLDPSCWILSEQSPTTP